jgi:hypothetical protein
MMTAASLPHSLGCEIKSASARGKGRISVESSHDLGVHSIRPIIQSERRYFESIGIRPTFDFARLKRNNMDGCASGLQFVAGNFEFRLFKAMGCFSRKWRPRSGNDAMRQSFLD